MDLCICCPSWTLEAFPESSGWIGGRNKEEASYILITGRGREPYKERSLFEILVDRGSCRQSKKIKDIERVLD